MFAGNVMCTDCLDKWDQISEGEYRTKAVEPVLIIGGDSKCKKHYREWRDRNQVTVEVEQLGLTPGS